MSNDDSAPLVCPFCPSGKAYKALDSHLKSKHPGTELSPEFEELVRKQRYVMNRRYETNRARPDDPPIILNVQEHEQPSFSAPEQHSYNAAPTSTYSGLPTTPVAQKYRPTLTPPETVRKPSMDVFDPPVPNDMELLYSEMQMMKTMLRQTLLTLRELNQKIRS